MLARQSLLLAQSLQKPTSCCARFPCFHVHGKVYKSSPQISSSFGILGFEHAEEEPRNPRRLLSGISLLAVQNSYATIQTHLCGLLLFHSIGSVRRHDGKQRSGALHPLAAQ